jgi:hypothetical protein
MYIASEYEAMIYRQKNVCAGTCQAAILKSACAWLLQRKGLPRPLRVDMKRRLLKSSTRGQMRFRVYLVNMLVPSTQQSGLYLRSIP